MPLFDVDVTRTAHSSKTIRVEADDEAQAMSRAEEQAPNDSFGCEHSSEYEAQGARPVASDHA